MKKLEGLENSGTRERGKGNHAIMGSAEPHGASVALGSDPHVNQSSATILSVRALRFSRRFCLNKGHITLKKLKITQKDKPTFGG